MLLRKWLWIGFEQSLLCGSLAELLEARAAGNFFWVCWQCHSASEKAFPCIVGVFSTRFQILKNMVFLWLFDIGYTLDRARGCVLPYIYTCRTHPKKSVFNTEVSTTPYPIFCWHTSHTPKKRIVHVCVRKRERPREKKRRFGTRESECEREKEGDRENERESVCSSTYHHYPCPCPSHSLHRRHSHNLYLYRMMKWAAGHFFFDGSDHVTARQRRCFRGPRTKSWLRVHPPWPSPSHRDILSCSHTLWEKKFVNVWIGLRKICSKHYTCSLQCTCMPWPAFLSFFLGPLRKPRDRNDSRKKERNKEKIPQYRGWGCMPAHTHCELCYPLAGSAITCRAIKIHNPSRSYATC